MNSLRKIKEKVTLGGQEYEMEWFDADKFSHLNKSKIKQIYGFLFDKDNKIVLVRPTKKRGWRLPGGGPEKEDLDWKDTIIREADEEADIDLENDSLIPVGYFKIIPLSGNCEKEVHYALRVVGKIRKVNDQTEDLSEGLINERIFVEPKDFLDYCSWNESGKIQRDKAIEIFKNDFKKSKKL
ncbi:NUDIX hydrolase [Candidatus Pacearchaeota archaeon]|nr:NUDIX hydrolase [Candidatus Pacearchaeota archaeon]